MDPNLAARIEQLESQLQQLRAEIDTIRAGGTAAPPTAKPTAFEHNRRMGLALTNATSLGVRCPFCAREGRSVEMTPPPGNRTETVDLGNYLLVGAFCASCGAEMRLWRRTG